MRSRESGGARTGSAPSGAQRRSRRARPTSTDPATSTEPVFEQVKAVLVVVLAANMPFVTRN